MLKSIGFFGLLNFLFTLNAFADSPADLKIAGPIRFAAGEYKASYLSNQVTTPPKAFSYYFQAGSDPFVGTDLSYFIAGDDASRGNGCAFRVQIDLGTPQCVDTPYHMGRDCVWTVPAFEIPAPATALPVFVSARSETNFMDVDYHPVPSRVTRKISFGVRDSTAEFGYTGWSSDVVGLGKVVILYAECGWQGQAVSTDPFNATTELLKKLPQVNPQFELSNLNE